MGGEDIQDEEGTGTSSLASEAERGTEHANSDKEPNGMGNVVAMRLTNRGTKFTSDVPKIWAKVRDSRGRYLTQALFVETIHTTSPYSPTYTLGECDQVGYPSARKIYLDLNDPTEYAPAIELLGSWEHWQALCGTTWFAPIIDQWRDELAIKLKCEATRKVIELTSAYESSSVLAAAKKLLDVLDGPKNATRRNKTRSNESSAETNTNPVGRPPKSPVIHDVSSEDTEADLKRILELG